MPCKDPSCTRPECRGKKVGTVTVVSAEEYGVYERPKIPPSGGSGGGGSSSNNEAEATIGLGAIAIVILLILQWLWSRG